MDGRTEPAHLVSRISGPIHQLCVNITSCMQNIQSILMHAELKAEAVDRCALGLWMLADGSSMQYDSNSIRLIREELATACMRSQVLCGQRAAKACSDGLGESRGCRL